MTTDVTQRELVLAYDGDCPMCLATVGMLIRFDLVAREQAISNHDLSAGDLAAAQAAGIRNQLVVLDPETRATRVGVDGLLWIIGQHRAHPWWVRALRLPGVRQLASLGYQAISYNRRIVSPPRHAIRCDCEPEVTVARRLMLIGPLGMASILIGALGGIAALQGVFDGDWRRAAVAGLTAAGAGSVAMALTALVVLRGSQRLDYLSHLVVTVFVGALCLVPLALVGWWLPPSVVLGLAAIALAAAILVMARMQRRRVAAVELSQRWRWAWLSATIAGLVVTLAVVFSGGA